MKKLAAFTGIVLVFLAIGGAALAATKQVTINDGNFSPTSVEITKGDTVNWTPKGNASHTVTAKDGSFNSDSSGQCQSSHYEGCLIDGGDDSPGIKKSFSHTFTNTGTFAYTCKVHGFSGAVVVKAPVPTPKPATPQPAPPVTQAPAPAQPTEVPTEAPASASASAETTPTPTSTLGTIEPFAVDDTGDGSNTGLLVGAIVGGLALAGAAGVLIVRLRRPV